MAGIIANDSGYACDGCGLTVYALVAGESYDLCPVCAHKYATEITALADEALARGEVFRERRAKRDAGGCI